MRVFQLNMLLLTGLLACSSEDTPPTPVGPWDAAYDAQDTSVKEVVASEAGPEAGVEADAGLVDDADAGPVVVGTPCTPDANTLQGDCPTGFVCMGIAGGYCTRFCAGGVECGPGARCIDTANASELCAAICEAEEDCRVSEGYFCHPQWKACTTVAPFNAAPIAPTCDPTAPLPRVTFGEPVQISTPAKGGLYNAEIGIALNAAGDLAALYSTRNALFEPGQGAVSVVRADGTLSLDHPFKSTRSEHYDNWMTSDRTGKMYAVWLGHDGKIPELNMEVGLSTSTDGLSWTTPRAIHDPADCPNNESGCLDKPMVFSVPDPATPSLDALYVFYFSKPQNGLRLLKSIDGGDTFGASAMVGPGCYGGAAISTAQGLIHVVWVNVALDSDLYGDNANSIQYVVGQDGENTFSKPVRINASDEPVPFYNSNPQVAVDPDQGAIYISYASGTPEGVWDIKLATSTDQGKTWQRLKVNDDPTCANHMAPALGLDPVTHRVHLAWLENRGGVGQVAYTSCSPGGATCNPNEVISANAFASYSFVRQSPKWMGEYFPLLIDATRRHIHVVWTQPVLEEGQPVGRVFHARGSL